MLVFQILSIPGEAFPLLREFVHELSSERPIFPNSSSNTLSSFRSHIFVAEVYGKQSTSPWLTLIRRLLITASTMCSSSPMTLPSSRPCQCNAPAFPVRHVQNLHVLNDRRQQFYTFCLRRQCTFCALFKTTQLGIAGTDRVARQHPCLSSER